MPRLPRSVVCLGFLITVSAIAGPCDPEPTACDQAQGEAGAETSCDGAGMCPEGMERDCLSFGTQNDITCQTMCMSCECVPSGGSLPGPGEHLPQ
jgi:hypothetical protein